MVTHSSKLEHTVNTPESFQIGPRAYICVNADNSMSVVRSAPGSLQPIQEPLQDPDVELLGVLEWYHTLGRSVARLWGEDCLIHLCSTSSGRWAVVAKTLTGEYRPLDSVETIARAIAVRPDLTAAEMPF